MRMLDKNWAIAAAAVTTLSGMAGVSHAAVDTWTGVVQAVNSGSNVYPTPSALWNTTDANWLTSTGLTRYSPGDAAVFNDNFTGITNIIIPSSGLNPNLVEFAHVGSGFTAYNFNATSTTPAFTSTSPWAGAYTTQSLVLDAGFNGSVTLNAAANALFNHSTTTVSGGNLILTANALPTYESGTQSTNASYVNLNGGMLTLNYAPGGTVNNGVLTVTNNSTIMANVAGTNSRTWNGQVNISAGKTLTINSANSTTVAQFGGIMVGSGGTLALANGTGTSAALVRIDTDYAGSQSVNYDLGTGNGTLRNNLGNGKFLYLGSLTGGAGTTLTGTDTAVTVAGAPPTFTPQITTYAVGSLASSTFAGHITDNAFTTTSAPIVAITNPTALNKIGVGTTLTLTGTSTNTGATTVTAGTLALDFNNAGAPATNILNSGLASGTGSALSVVGGTFLVNGKTGAASSQTMNGLTLGGGAGSINVVNGSGGTATLNLGALTRSSGGVVDFVGNGTVNTTTANASVSGGQQTILGGYATVNGNTWAVSGSGATAGTISGLSSYASTAAAPIAAGQDVDVAAGGNNGVAAATTVNSVRFNDGAATALDATGGLTVATGGVLVTPTAGNVLISNGSITTGSGDLVLIQNSPNSTLTVNSAVVGATKILTTAGPGTIALTNTANTQQRNVLNGGVLQIAGDGALGTVPAAVGGNININDGGTLQFAANTTLATNRSTVLGFNGGTFDTMANTVTYGGAISGNGAFNKAGSGTLILTNATAVNTPSTTVTNNPVNILNGRLVVTGTATALGTSNLSSPVVLGSGSNSGVLQLGDGTAAVVTNISGLSISGTGTGNAVVAGGFATPSTLVVSTDYDSTFSGTLGGTGTNQNLLAVTKTNPNNGRNLATTGFSPSTLTLTGANTYDAVTTIGDGTLSVSTINSVGAGHTASSNLGSPTSAATGTIALTANQGPATLLYTGAGETTDRVLSLSNGTYAATVDASGSGPLTFTSNVANATVGARTFALQGSNTGANTISGAIVDSGTTTNITSVTKLGTGTWTLSGANTYTGPTVVAAGKLVVGSNGGIAANVAANGAGTVAAVVSVGSGATLQLAPGIGTQTVKTLNIAYGGAKLDLTNNTLNLHYGTATGTTDPVNTIIAAVNSGANFGTGIINSALPGASYGIGYSDTGLPTTDNPTATGDIVIKTTVLGDANLDGVVNFNDFLVLQANFGTTPSAWYKADFTYDGITNFNDFLALQANFGSTATGGRVFVPEAQIAALAAFAVEYAPVPEPTSLAVLGLGAAAVLRRRRRA